MSVIEVGWYAIERQKCQEKGGEEESWNVHICMYLRKTHYYIVLLDNNAFLKKMVTKQHL